MKFEHYNIKGERLVMISLSLKQSSFTWETLDSKKKKKKRKKNFLFFPPPKKKKLKLKKPKKKKKKKKENWSVQDHTYE